MNETLKKIIFTIVGLLIVAGLGIAAWKFYQSQQLLKKMQNPNAANEKEISKIVEQVGRLISLPEGETPSVATVSDKEKLKDQSFFERAENGDKVLIYTEAKKAYLYRPSTNMLIEVAPLNIADNPQPGGSQVTSSPPPQAAPVKIALYNGTSSGGLTTRFETQLQNSGIANQVVTKQAAAKLDYSQSVIIDLTGNNADTVGSLSEKFSLTVGSLPSGETKPNADILIILGTSTQ